MTSEVSYMVVNVNSHEAGFSIVPTRLALMLPMALHCFGWTLALILLFHVAHLTSFMCSTLQKLSELTRMRAGIPELTRVWCDWTMHVPARTKEKV